MPEQDPDIQELEDRLDRLVRTQIDFQKEISAIRGELAKLHGRGPRAEHARPGASTARPSPSVGSTLEPNAPVTPPREPRQTPPPRRQSAYEPDAVLSSTTASSGAFAGFASKYTENARGNMEKFIGANLISLIGIVVLVLGVGIGAKYAIDNNLISPLTRIIIGYIFGFGLVGLAIKLKPKYHNFSAVLISGGMAIMYFVTYFAYAAYSLISQMSAFALMVMFTAFTVTAALVYSRQVIAHIGLVGAYAVPFLLSDDSGNYLALFIYMTVVNLGILGISIKRDWNPIFYTASAFTWIIFTTWFGSKYDVAQHFGLALIFLAVFFAIFYATKLLQKRLDLAANATENLVSALVTGLIFYAFAGGIHASVAEVNNYWIAFSYIAGASLLILVTSFKPYGRAFMYLVLPLAWYIYAGWFLDRYNAESHFYLAATFAAVFFAVFYSTILIHRLLTDELSVLEHTSLVLSNAFVFYGFGYLILDQHETLRNYLGLYTAANAALHFAVSTFVSRFRPGAIDVVQVLTILVLTFASIAIPVQFDGNFVTMIWAVEAALLFWFGRVRGVRLFEFFSYPVMVLATGSMFMDWAWAYSSRASGSAPITPIANGDFVTALVFVVAFVFIYLTNRDEESEPAVAPDMVPIIGHFVGGLAIFVLYNMFRTEIGNYYHLQLAKAVEQGINYPVSGDLDRFNVAWQINYTLFFLTALGVGNLQKLRSALLAIVNYALGSFTLAVFATVSMFVFYELRVSYMSGNAEAAVSADWLYVGIRHISYLVAAGMLYVLYRYSRDSLLAEYAPNEVRSLIFEATAYGFVFVVASCEVVNLMGQLGIPDSTKLGLSIFWGVYALALIVIGIAWDKKHLRITAMVLLAVTLVKLFFYDIADLDTIPKTILFVTLGITLLAVSFLYNKYKDLIFKREVTQDE